MSVIKPNLKDPWLKDIFLRRLLPFVQPSWKVWRAYSNWRKRNDDYNDNMSAYLFNSGGLVVGKERTCRLDDKSLSQAHRYVLLYSDDMKELIE